MAGIDMNNRVAVTADNVSTGPATDICAVPPPLAGLGPWWQDDLALRRLLADLLRGELARLRPGEPGRRPLAGVWPDPLLLDEEGLGADSLERLRLAAAVDEMLGGGAAGRAGGEQLLERRTFGEWLQLCRRTLAAGSADLPFRSSGSTGTGGPLGHGRRHPLTWLDQEVAQLVSLIGARARVLSAVPAHHIYGFLFTVRLPQALGGLPVIDLRAHGPAALVASWRPGDLVVAHPDYWAGVARLDVAAPEGVIGISSTAPCPAELAVALDALGLRLIEVFGSTETAGLGWRDDPDRPFRWFPYWSWDGGPEALRRTPDDRRIGIALPDHLRPAGPGAFWPGGRRDHVVQVGGTNVDLGRVRDALREHPWIADAAVRLMRPEEGSRLKAFIVPAPKAPPSAGWHDDLIAWIDRRLPPPARPRALRFGSRLPTTLAGKPADWSVLTPAEPQPPEPAAAEPAATGIAGLQLTSPGTPPLPGGALARRIHELEQLLHERSRALGEGARELAAEMQRREEAENALHQAQKLEALGHLTSEVVHDIGNVFQAVLTGLDLLAGIGEGEAEARIERLVRDEVERGRSLIERLLAFARKDEVAPGLIDPARLLGGLKEILGCVVKKNVSLTFDIGAGVWPVVANAHRFETALINLAANARDAMPEGGTLRLSVRNLPAPAPAAAAGPGPGPVGEAEGEGVRLGADRVVFAVADSGVGMTPEVLARATEPYFTTKGAGRGTGLGLASARSFAEQAGGNLRLESEPGRGTVVEIILPRAWRQPNPAVALWNGSAPGRQGQILVAESHDGRRAALAGPLRAAGHRVIEASSREAAIVLSYAIGPLDLALSSAALALGEEGLASRLRIERPRLPLVILAEPGAVVDPAGAADALLVAPFSDRDLLELVADRLEAASLGEREVLLSERLLARLQEPLLRQIYRSWREARGYQALPRYAEVRTLLEPCRDDHFIVAVEPRERATGIHFLSVGAALTARLGRDLVGSGFDLDQLALGELGTLAGAYARCVRSRLPGYEMARLATGDRPPVRFERLILPVARDGRTLSHLFGVVRFDQSFPDLTPDLPGTSLQPERDP